jgi:hypothetical protein
VTRRLCKRVIVSGRATYHLLGWHLAGPVKLLIRPELSDLKRLFQADLISGLIQHFALALVELMPGLGILLSMEKLVLL